MLTCCINLVTGLISILMIPIVKMYANDVS